MRISINHIHYSTLLFASHTRSPLSHDLSTMSVENQAGEGENCHVIHIECKCETITVSLFQQTHQCILV